MKIALPSNQYFDDQGRPLVCGRVSVHYHASDILVPIYTLSSGHGYIEAANPYITLDDGRIPTLYFEAGIVDVWLEKALPDGSYEFLDSFSTGFQLPDVTNDTVVSGVEALRNTDPAVGVVNVVGYENGDDAPSRYFVWDSSCDLEPDGGVIFDSASGGSGRWVLLWDGETLPSSVYGIKPGVNEANIAAFLQYPDNIGTYGIRTPAYPRFLSGTYTTSAGLASTRTVLFDTGAKFISATFACPDVIIQGNTDYVADFTITGAREAHSSWFRTVTDFWFCGAQKLVIDNVNYFTDLVLRGKPTVADTVIEGAKRIPMTYVNGNFIKLENCTLNASEIFNPSQDYIKFSSMGWSDDLWNTVTASSFDFGKISDGHHVEFLGVALNRQQLSQFRDTAVYVRMREAERLATPTSSAVLDMQGRSLTSFSSPHFGKLMNCRVTGNISLSDAPSGFQMQNVVCEGQINGGSNLAFTDVIGSMGVEWTGSLDAFDCVLSGNTVTGNHRITVVGGNWRKSINNATDNTADTGAVIFRDCVLDGMNTVIKTKKLNLINCGVYEQTIEIYPFYNTASSCFMFNTRMENCEINGSTPVAYKIFHDLNDGCKDCVLACTWIGNSWFGNELGLTMEFWADSNVYSQVISRENNFVVYSGNSGYCPLEAWHGSQADVNWIQCSFYPADGDSPLQNYFRADISMRCCPDWNRNNLTHGTTYGSWMGPAYQISGGASTKAYLYASNPLPSYLGYGDAFESCVVKYGGAGDSTVTYV